MQWRLQEDSLGFAAYACHPELGAEVARGTIVFDGGRLRFDAERVTIEVPLVELELNLVEPAGEVCFSNPRQPDWTIHCPDMAVLKHRALLQATYTRNQIRALQSRAELTRRLKITGLFLLACVVVAVVGSILTGMVVRSLVARVPLEWEQELGDSLMQKLKASLDFVEEAPANAKLMRAMTPLVNALPPTGRQFDFHLVQDPRPNAFALPGGHVIVTTRLLEIVDRPEELAGVVAHEIAHVTQRHGFRKVIAGAGPYLIFKVFLRQRNGALGVLGGASALLVNQSFSQEYELEADAVGWQYLAAARIDPRGMIDVLLKLDLEQQRWRRPGQGLPAFRSHPATLKRIQRLEALWRKQKDKTGFIRLE